MRKRSLRAAAFAALLGSAALAGCVYVPVDRGYAYDTDVVNVAPPPPRAEYYGAPPVVGSVWINGYWGWGGGGHRWVPGRWAGARPGYHWEPHRWVPYGGGWRLGRGHWERG